MSAVANVMIRVDVSAYVREIERVRDALGSAAECEDRPTGGNR